MSDVPEEVMTLSEAKTTAKRFTEEEKKTALSDLSSMSAKDVAIKHDCSVNSLMMWKKKLAKKSVVVKEKKEPKQPTVKKNVDLGELLLAKALEDPTLRKMVINFLVDQLK